MYKKKKTFGDWVYPGSGVCLDVCSIKSKKEEAHSIYGTHTRHTRDSTTGTKMGSAHRSFAVCVHAGHEGAHGSSHGVAAECESLIG